MARRSRKKVTSSVNPPPLSRYKNLDLAVRKHRRHIYTVSLVLNLFLCLLLFDPKPHTGGDNALYIILAESILRTGDGFSDTIGPGESKPHTQYPFGFPLLLAPLVALAGRNLIVLKLLSLILSLGSVALFSRLVERIASPPAWAFLSLAVAANPVIIEYSHWVLSEMPFLFFSLLALYYLIAWEEEEKGRLGRKFWFSVLAMAFTVHIRSAGIVFPAAGFLYFAMRKHWRTLAVFTLSMVLLLSPWIIRNRLASGSSSNYVQALFMRNPYAPEEGTVSGADLAKRVITNLKIYSGSEMARVILGSEVLDRESTAVKVFSVAATLLLVAGLVFRLARGYSLLEIYMLVFLGVVLLWPEAWSDVRFIMPVAPFILFYLAEGVSLILWPFLLDIDAAGVLGVLTVCLVALFGLGTQLRGAPDNLVMLGHYFHGDYYAGYPPAWRNFFQAADWVKENTPKSSVVTVRKPSLFYLHTGRRVDGYPFTANADSVLAQITKTDYVIIDAVSGTTYRYLVPAIQKEPERFKLVFRTGEPFTGVLEVVR